VHHLDVGVDDLLDKGKCQDQVKEPRVSDLVCTVVEQGSHGGAIRVDSIVSEHPKGVLGILMKLIIIRKYCMFWSQIWSTLKRREIKFLQKTCLVVIRSRWVILSPCSSRIQEQILTRGGGQMKSSTKKRSLQGTSLNNQNSFAALDNEVIADIAGCMGINVAKENFETFDLMKDIELDRHTLNNVKKDKIPDPNEGSKELNMIDEEIPLLQWLDNDSEVEQFTLVQSKRKKKGIVQLGWKK
jgi:hypothetical protein